MKLKVYVLLAAGAATLLSTIPQANARMTLLGRLQDAKTVQCPGSTCTLEFQAAGNNKNSFIQTVSCWINVSRNSSLKPVVERLQLNQSAANGVHVFLAPVQVLNTNAGEQIYQVFVSGLDYHVPPTSKPQIVLELSGGTPPSGMGLICSITGKIDQ